jgi:glucan phosphoethanolaminetransferase (alkaline phosphatase superfamily)
MSNLASQADGKRKINLGRAGYVALWTVAFILLIVATNSGFQQRLELLVGQDRLTTLLLFIAMWGVCIGALLLAALQTNLAVRAFWAVVLAFATAGGFLFRQISGNEIGVLDVVSLWTVRHEASRAEDFYASHFHVGIAVLAASFLILLTAPRVRNATVRKWIGRLWFAPLVPMVMIAAIIFMKEGGGSQALPVQFQPLSVAAVSGTVLAKSPTAERPAVTATAGEHKIRNVVFLVDESIRADYIDWTPGNRFTPALAAARGHIADFGPALSAGNCSSYSNALLRFTAGPDDLGGAILKVPTIWQYAKQAGYRTVFVDAQSAFNKNTSKFQNYMTADEAKWIDKLYFLPEETPAPELDYRLLDIIAGELKSPEPVFIYANKNGAHFPYDHDYPNEAKAFQPTMTDSAADTAASRINSYRNAVAWTVDGFFARLFKEIDLGDTALVYTSDHGQNFDPAAFTHCSVESPDPREAVVPLFVATENPQLHQRFADAAARAGGGQSHFAIMPTIIELFGFDTKGLDRKLADSLLDGGKPVDFFTSGDIFGLFSETRRHVADPKAPLLERPETPVETSRLE